MIAGFVFLLSAATSLACAAMLWRTYGEKRVRLLFWATLCFLGFTIENVTLFLDRVIVPDIDLTVPRLTIGLASVGVFVYGLIRDVA